jgi:hypothetical protein
MPHQRRQPPKTVRKDDTEMEKKKDFCSEEEVNVYAAENNRFIAKHMLKVEKAIIDDVINFELVSRNIRFVNVKDRLFLVVDTMGGRNILPPEHSHAILEKDNAIFVPECLAHLFEEDNVMIVSFGNDRPTPNIIDNFKVKFSPNGKHIEKAMEEAKKHHDDEIHSLLLISVKGGRAILRDSFGGSCIVKPLRGRLKGQIDDDFIASLNDVREWGNPDEDKVDG